MASNSGPAQLSITIPNLDKFKSAFTSFPELVLPFLRQASTKSAFKVEREAKQVTPVDTGRLRSSIATSLGVANKGISSIVSTNVNYAIYVHEGTRSMRKRPFMKQAVDASMGYIEQVYKQELTGAVDALAKKAT